MKLMHFLALMFFASILLYLGLKNPDGVKAIFTGGTDFTTSTAKVLQGR